MDTTLNLLGSDKMSLALKCFDFLHERVNLWFPKGAKQSVNKYFTMHFRRLGRNGGTKEERVGQLDEAAACWDWQGAGSISL